MSHFLVAVDGSGLASAAVRFAVDLAARAQARLTVCSAVDPASVMFPAVEGAAVDFGPLLNTLGDNAQAFCNEGKRLAENRNVACATEVLNGPVASEIVRYASEHEVDAIVLGTHARTGLSRAILGSVASETVHHSTVPVLIVGAKAAVREGPIAVAVDDSPPALAAVETAAALARAMQVPLHLIHCDDGHPFAQDAFSALAQGLRDTGLTVRTEMCAGETAPALLGAAERQNASLVATGTHARSAVGRLILGSVAEAIVRDAPLPVMVVRR